MTAAIASRENTLTNFFGFLQRNQPVVEIELEEDTKTIFDYIDYNPDVLDLKLWTKDDLVKELEERRALVERTIEENRHVLPTEFCQAALFLVGINSVKPRNFPGRKRYGRLTDEVADYISAHTDSNVRTLMRAVFRSVNIARGCYGQVERFNHHKTEGINRVCYLAALFHKESEEFPRLSDLVKHLKCIYNGEFD